MQRRSELAWAAGFMEGEGSILIRGPQPRSSCSLTVETVNTDPQRIEFFSDRWAGYTKRVELPGNRRPAWRWIIAARQAASFLLEIRPYVVSVAFLAKIDLALAFQAQKSRGRINRTPVYRKRQLRYHERMRLLNLRGKPSEA